jgi:hypothetical protein
MCHDEDKNRDKSARGDELQKEMRDVDVAYEEFDAGHRRFLNNDLQGMQVYYRDDAEMRAILDDVEQSTREYSKTVSSAIDERIAQLEKEKAKLNRNATEEGDDKQ